MSWGCGGAAGNGEQGPPAGERSPEVPTGDSQVERDPVADLPGDDGASPTCLDLAAAQPCDGDPLVPEVLLRAADFGPGFELISINQRVVLARAEGRHRAALLSPGEPTRFLDLRTEPGAGETFELRDAAWTTWSEERGFWVLGCAGEDCRVFSADAADDLGLPMGPLAARPAIEAEWAPVGLITQFPPEGANEELCIYGRGIFCLRNGLWIEDLSGAESGDLVRVVQGLAINADGRVFQQNIYASPMWSSADASVVFDRLTLGGALGDDGAWLEADLNAKLSCVAGPRIVSAASALRGVLDAQGNVYQRLRRSGEPLFCSVLSPSGLGLDPSLVIEDSQLDCGIHLNWAVLTRQELLGVFGPLGCAVD